MSVQVKRRRDTAANLAAFTGAPAELLVDTTNNRVQVHDGATAGGWPAAKLSEVVTNTRAAVADAAYTALAGDRTIAFTSLTAARVVTLPAASAFPTGTPLVVVDESGACSATDTITLARAGTDTIDGATSAIIATPYGYLALQSNGTGKWTIVAQSTGSLGGLTALGIGTAADPGNPLSVNATNALFNSAGDIRVKLNKASSTNTASFLYQDGFSGRAEIGLCGDDNFHFKVSADGSTWVEAVNIDASTGALSALSVSGAFTISSGATQFTLSQRSAVSTQAVASLRPTSINTSFSLDLIPNGVAVPTFGDMITWIDICDADVSSNTSTPVNKLMLATRASVMEIGSNALYGGAGKPLIFSYLGTEIFRINATGMAIGTTDTNGKFTVSYNAVPLPPTTMSGQIGIHLGSADGGAGNAVRFLFDGFGGGGYFDFRRANTSNASPSALVANDVIGQIEYNGHNGSSYANIKAAILGVAAENWSTTANGTYLSFFTTTKTTTTVAERLRIDDAGNLFVAANSKKIADQNGTLFAGSFTVGALPTPGNVGRMAFASNGRMYNGTSTLEGPGAGTGGLVVDNGTTWKIAGTNQTVQA